MELYLRQLDLWVNPPAGARRWSSTTPIPLGMDCQPRTPIASRRTPASASASASFSASNAEGTAASGRNSRSARNIAVRSLASARVDGVLVLAVEWQVLVQHLGFAHQQADRISNVGSDVDLEHADPFSRTDNQCSPYVYQAGIKIDVLNC